MSRNNIYTDQNVDIERVFEIYDAAKNKILLYVESSVSPEQFRALRKLILDELGNSGAQGKVRALSNWKGQADTAGRGDEYECINQKHMRQS